jgi:diadenylate cyclase
LDDIIGAFPALRTFGWRDGLIAVADILLVAFLIYRLLMLVRGTRAWRILVGIGIFIALLGVSDRLHLATLHWVLASATPLGPVALVILLLPELRQAIEGLGKLDRWTQRLASPAETRAEARTVEEIVAAAAELAAGRVGALIVLEKAAPLDDIVANGVELDASVSAPLLGAIFYEGNPLHDGAVVIRGDAILAAACRLPLSESTRIDQSVHMRHRAAVGVTEATDAICIAVSEERGTISVASEGRLRRLNGHLELRDILNRELRRPETDASKRRPRKEPVKP